MADEPDATLVIEPDEPAFVKAIEEMASKMESRFKKSGEVMKSSFAAAGGGLQPGQSFAQSPMAQTTKELEKQLKWAKEITKTERERREIARARRFEANREKYGDDIELDETGNVKRLHGAQAGRRRIIGGVATGINAAGTLAFGGGSVQSGISAGAMIGSMLAPEIAPILNAIAGQAMAALDASDTRVEAMLRGYQVGGFRGTLQAQGNESVRGTSMKQFREWTGFDLERFSNLQTHLGRKTGGLNNLDTLMGIENAFGMGGQAVNMLGANARSGRAPSEPEQEKALGTAMALAMGQGLERGRFGEIFDQLTSALEANTKGVSDIEALGNRFLFISQLGPQYRGNTAASREMNGALQSLAKGDKPFTQIAMLRAAGFGQKGVSYASAWLATQTGLDVAGGVSSENMIKMNFGSYIPQYARGNNDQKAAIVMQLSLLTGMNGAQVKAIMDRLSRGPLAHLDTAQGWDRIGGEANMVGDADKMLKVRQQKTKGENMKAGAGNFVAWLGGQGDRRDVLGSNPYIDAHRDQTGLKKDGGASGSNAPAPTTRGGGSSQFQQYRSSGGAFGAQRNDTKKYGMKAGHPGEDLFFPPGTTVYSPCNGTVIVAGYFAMPGEQVEKANGWAIWVQSSDDGLVWQFVHIDPATTTLRKGSKVKQGDIIGKTLSFAQWKSGVKTHLHLGVSKGGKQQNPLDYDLSGITQPMVGQVRSSNAQSTTGAGSSGGSYGPVTTPGQNGDGSIPGVNAPITSPSQVNVVVTVMDRTQHGVDVKRENDAYRNQANQPSPGDAPITRPDQVP